MRRLVWAFASRTYTYHIVGNIMSRLIYWMEVVVGNSTVMMASLVVEMLPTVNSSWHLFLLFTLSKWCTPKADLKCDLKSAYCSTAISSHCINLYHLTSNNNNACNIMCLLVTWAKYYNASICLRMTSVKYWLFMIGKITKLLKIKIASCSL